MMETRLTEQQKPFIFFSSVEEAKDHTNTTFNVAEMPIGGFIKYNNKLYRIQKYNNTTCRMEVIDTESHVEEIDSTDNAYYLGDNLNS